MHEDAQLASSCAKHENAKTHLGLLYPNVDPTSAILSKFCSANVGFVRNHANSGSVIMSKLFTCEVEQTNYGSVTTGQLLLICEVEHTNSRSVIAVKLLLMC